MKALAEGFEVGPYRILAEVGRGGMASVYRAYQPSLDRFVAVKILHDSGDETFRERFRREARTIARLRHPNIIQVHDFGEQDELVYLVMELVEGATLRERMAGLLPPEHALSIVAQLASALDYAHANGVVHRDVKPGNVLIDSDDRVLLGDFGIARLQADSGLTREQASLGTPEYMSPEQAAAGEVGPASDVYSLGIVAYQLLTGQVPFQGDTALGILHAHVHTPPPAATSVNPALPAAVDEVFGQALAKRPEDRFGAAADLARRLREAVVPEFGATMATASYRLPPKRGRDLRNWAALGLTALVALLLIVFVGRPLASRALRLSPLVGLTARSQASSPAGAIPSASAIAPPTASGAPASTAAVVASPAVPASAATAIAAAATFGANASAAAAATATAASAATSPPRSPTPFPAVAPTAVAIGPNPPIHLQTSTDGVHFANELTLGDAKGHVMSALPLSPGVTRVYASDSEFLRLRSWRSSQAAWVSEPTEVQGAPAGLLYGSVVALPEGGFRLYYVPQNGPSSTMPSGPRDVLSARSGDGVRFVQEPGARLTYDGLATVTVVKTDAGWLMLFRSDGEPAAVGARSSDGLTFSVAPSISFQAPMSFRVTSIDGAYSFLQFRFDTNKSERFVSADGATWRFDRELDARFRDGTGPSPQLLIKDAAGQYRLIYSWVLLPSAAAKPG